MADKKQKQSFRTKYLDKGFNLVSISTGIIITFVICFFISLITYTIIPSTNLSILEINLINAIEVIGVSVIGGFIATYIGKEKQLLNGICVGLGIILISIISHVYLIIQGHSNLDSSSPIITLFATLGYILAPTLGSYIAIKAT